MSYLPSIVLAALGVVLLVILLMGFFRGLRRFRSAMSMVTTATHERTGLLKARSAGLKLAFAQRRQGSENQ